MPHETIKIDVAKDFSRYPAGRYRSDGAFSGEEFREKYLVPVIEAGKHAVINLDGTRGYGSSFLEEAFGGLVRLGYKPEQIVHAFEFKCDDESVVKEIYMYIKSENGI